MFAINDVNNTYECVLQVAVLTSSGEYLCGGVIVTERHVLTVAHCISAVSHSVKDRGMR